MPKKAPKGKKLLLFATLHYWVEQAAMIGLALRGMGHDVTIAYSALQRLAQGIESL